MNAQGLWIKLALLVSMVFLAGCGSTPEIWEERTYEGVRQTDVFGIVKRVIDTEYKLIKTDPGEGVIETLWDDPMVGYQRLSTRRRVVAEVLGGSGEPVAVRVRVPTQTTSTPSPVFALEEDEWEDAGDDPVKARYFITMIHSMLGDFGPSENFLESQRGLPGEVE